MSEFAFELELCAALEARSDDIVARQLGASVASPGARIVDVAVIEPGPAFEARTQLTPATIPDVAIAADVGPGRWRRVRDAFDCHPERARAAVDRAVEIGFFERERRDGSEYVRQVARYPDWFDRIVGIENKPDLGTPGDLARQLRIDASLGLFDVAILATESHVTGAHRNRIPDEIGLWRVHRDADVEIEVLREPVPLAVDEYGIEPVEYTPGRTDVVPVSPERKARARRRIAERAYGKGWRTFGFPACANGSPGGRTPGSRTSGGRTSGGRTLGSHDVGDGTPADPSTDSETPARSEKPTLPYCSWKGRVVDAAVECGPACDGYEQSDPPAVDLDRERDARTPWVADPSGAARRQSGLDRFDER